MNRPTLKLALVIGLTGPIASGKSTVAKLFEKLGARIISADKIVHDLRKFNTPEYNATVDYFGKKVLTTHGVIDPVKLAELVDESGHNLEVLTDIFTPAVRAEIREQVRQFRAKNKGVLVLEVPRLFQSNLHKVCDITIACVCDDKLRRARALKRPGMTATRLKLYEQRNLSTAQVAKRADVAIQTDVSEKETEKQVREVVKKLKN